MCCFGSVGMVASVGNPQGVLPAPVGTTAITSTGASYVKLGGGSTAWGWYRNIHGADMGEFWAMNVARFNSAGNAVMQGIGMANGTIGGGTQFPTSFGAGQILQMAGIYTNLAAIGSTALFRSGAIASAVPIGSGQINEQNMPWDIVMIVRTTPRPLVGSAAPTVAGLRMWFVALVQNATETTQASLANSDNLQAAFVNSQTINAGLWGGGFRFSTGAADPGFMLVSSNDDGVGATQTVTDANAPVAVNSIYKLRLRYDGATRLAGSVDDGPEVVNTVNVGPGTANGGNRGLMIYASATCLEAQLKSIGWGKTYIVTGAMAA